MKILNFKKPSANFIIEKIDGQKVLGVEPILFKTGWSYRDDKVSIEEDGYVYQYNVIGVRLTFLGMERTIDIETIKRKATRQEYKEAGLPYYKEG